VNASTFIPSIEIHRSGVRGPGTPEWSKPVRSVEHEHVRLMATGTGRANHAGPGMALQGPAIVDVSIQQSFDVHDRPFHATYTVTVDGQHAYGGVAEHLDFDRYESVVEAVCAMVARNGSYTNLTQTDEQKCEACGAFAALPADHADGCPIAEYDDPAYIAWCEESADRVECRSCGEYVRSGLISTRTGVCDDCDADVAGRPAWAGQLDAVADAEWDTPETIPATDPVVVAAQEIRSIIHRLAGIRFDLSNSRHEELDLGYGRTLRTRHDAATIGDAINLLKRLGQID
jgi:hypothetical protein